MKQYVFIFFCYININNDNTTVSLVLVLTSKQMNEILKILHSFGVRLTLSAVVVLKRWGQTDADSSSSVCWWFRAAAALDKSGRVDGGPVTTQAPESRRQLHANSMAALFIIQSQVYWNGKENYTHWEECDRTRSVKPGHLCHNPRQSECWETGLQAIKQDNRITLSR